MAVLFIKWIGGFIEKGVGAGYGDLVGRIGCEKAKECGVILFSLGELAEEGFGALGINRFIEFFLFSDAEDDFCAGERGLSFGFEEAEFLGDAGAVHEGR